MTMGGGTFLTHNKVLPGAYINFIAAGNGVTLGERGVAAMPLALDWGPEGTIIHIAAEDFNAQARKVLGYDPTAQGLLLVRECFKRAKELLIYRVDKGGAKASVSAGDLNATAKYPGKRGNSLAVAVEVNAENEERRDVVTYLDRDEVDRQTISAPAELAENDYVTFAAGDRPLEETAAVALTGGTNGTATGQSYADCLTALEVEAWNVLGYPGDDVEIKALVAAYIKRLREQEGFKAVAVLAEYPNADYEGIISVKNGVLLETGETLSPAQAVAWVTGASASAEMNESLTNTAYEGAVDAVPKYTKTGYEDAVKAGGFTFYCDNGRARVLTDVNTLTTFGKGKNSDWTSNRVIRVLDSWANDVARIFGASYIGLQTNDAIGRQLFKADLVSLAKQYQSIQAISNFSPEDIEIAQGQGKRDVAVSCALQPNDSMEKLYMVVTVI